MSAITLTKAEVNIIINSGRQTEIRSEIMNFPANPQNKIPVSSSIKYSNNSNLKDYNLNKPDNAAKFSQIIIDNLDPKFNPLQVKLIGKTYDSNFSSSIHFVDVFSQDSGSKIYIDKKANKLYISNFMPMLTKETTVTSQFSKINKDGAVTNKDHIIGKIIILYDMSYNDF
jgi:hypothetical protein